MDVNINVTVIIGVYYSLANIILFILMGVDKKRAIERKWRIQEALLFAVAAIGGALGGFAGMFMFRHKNRKPLFHIIYGISLVVHIIIILYLLKVF